MRLKDSRGPRCGEASEWVRTTALTLNVVMVIALMSWSFVFALAPPKLFPAGLQKVLSPETATRVGSAINATRTSVEPSANHSDATTTPQKAAAADADANPIRPATESSDAEPTQGAAGPTKQAARPEERKEKKGKHTEERQEKSGEQDEEKEDEEKEEKEEEEEEQEEEDDQKNGANVEPSDENAAKTGSGVAEHQTSRGFLCDPSGFALPKLQVLGAQKSGTTTLFVDLHTTLSPRKDLTCHGLKPWGCKESTFFNWPQGRRYYELWGPCSRVRRGKVIADFSVGNLKWPYAAQGMHEEYGELAKDLVLVVGLRHPLNRMLAAFAHGLRENWLYIPSDRERTFEDHCRYFLQEWDRRGEGWLPELWRDLTFRTVDQSLYGYKLRLWLDAGFHPSQFIIFPGNVYLKHRDDSENNPLLQALRTKLGSQYLHPKKVQTAKVFNQGHNHDTADHDLQDAHVRDRLNNEIFAPSNRALVKLLSEGAQAGMTLVGYSGEATDLAALEKWLQDNWDY